MAGVLPDRHHGKASAETLMRWELLRILAGARDKSNQESEEPAQLPPGFENLDITGPLSAEKIESVDAALHALASEELKAQEPGQEAGSAQAEPPKNGLRSLMLPQTVAQLHREDSQQDQTYGSELETPFIDPGRLRRTVSAPSSKRRYRVSISGRLPSVPDESASEVAQRSKQLQVPGGDGRGAHRRTVSAGRIEQTSSEQISISVSQHEGSSFSNVAPQAIPQAPSNFSAAGAPQVAISGTALSGSSAQQGSVLPPTPFFRRSLDQQTGATAVAEQRSQSPRPAQSPVPGPQLRPITPAAASTARPLIPTGPPPPGAVAPARQGQGSPHPSAHPGGLHPSVGGRPPQTAVPSQQAQSSNTTGASPIGSSISTPSGQHPMVVPPQTSKLPTSQVAQHASTIPHQGAAPNRAPSIPAPGTRPPPAHPGQSPGRPPTNTGPKPSLNPATGPVLPAAHPASSNPRVASFPAHDSAHASPATLASHPIAPGHQQGNQVSAPRTQAAQTPNARAPNNPVQTPSQMSAQRAGTPSKNSPMPPRQAPLPAPSPQRPSTVAGLRPSPGPGTPASAQRPIGVPTASPGRSAAPNASPMGRPTIGASPAPRPAGTAAGAAPSKPLPNSPYKPLPAPPGPSPAGGRSQASQAPAARPQAQSPRVSHSTMPNAVVSRPQTPQLTPQAQAMRRQTPAQAQVGGPTSPNAAAIKAQTPQRPASAQAMQPQTPGRPQTPQGPASQQARGQVPGMPRTPQTLPAQQASRPQTPSQLRPPQSPTSQQAMGRPSPGRSQTPQGPHTQQAMRSQTPVQTQLGQSPRPHSMAGSPQTSGVFSPKPGAVSMTPAPLHAGRAQSPGVQALSGQAPLRNPFQSPTPSQKMPTFANAQPAAVETRQNPSVMAMSSPGAGRPTAGENAAPGKQEAQQPAYSNSMRPMPTAAARHGATSPQDQSRVNSQKEAYGQTAGVAPAAANVVSVASTSQIPKPREETTPPPFMGILSGQGAAPGSGPSHGIELVDGDFTSGEMFEMLMAGRIPRDLASEQNSQSALQLTAQGLLYMAQGFLGPRARTLTVDIAEAWGVI